MILPSPSRLEGSPSSEMNLLTRMGWPWDRWAPVFAPCAWGRSVHLDPLMSSSCWMLDPDLLVLKLLSVKSYL